MGRFVIQYNTSKGRVVFTRLCEFFYAARHVRFFLCPNKEKIMQMEIPETQNETICLAYNVARIVYAETLAVSLRVVEALTSMIFNAAHKDIHNIAKILRDKNIFESLNNESVRHKYLFVDVSKHDFQMCLRVAMRMLHGNLGDSCNHATTFHRDELLPDWAVARGYVADIDGILFYA